MDMRQKVRQAIEKAYDAVARREGWESPASFEISHPKEEKFGDFATNAAMIAASRLKKNPREIAQKIVDEISADALFSSVNVAGPGFINMTIKPEKWVDAIPTIIDGGDDFGKSGVGNGARVIVEFMSANPTGPLHVGHGRVAVVGDMLARLLTHAGYNVHREYYINDVGLQMDNLGRSTIERAKEILGRSFGEPAYKGDYMKDIARDFLDKFGNDVMDKPEDELLSIARGFTAEDILKDIKNDLANFRVTFDEWFSEERLHSAGGVEGAIQGLVENGHVYENEGALWLKTDTAGDDKDRVVKRANGVTTYLAADIAYHKNKLDRGFQIMVDVWGADHHGYIPRMKSVIQALGADPERLVVRLVQIVNLKRGGELVAMSTRSGVFTTLREIVDEVGVDATRYFFLMRSADSHLDFDVDLAKKHSDENPVFYIQYAHARCVNIFGTAKERGVPMVPFAEIDKSLIQNPDELRLIRKLLQFPEVVADCAQTYQPHPITQYLTDTAALFHYFYKHNRVVVDDVCLTQARLWLVESVRIVLRNGLDLLGITAPERM